MIVVVKFCTICSSILIVIVGLIVIRRLTKTKSIGNGQDLESQSGRQSDGYGGWCLELRREGRYGDEDESGYRL